MLSSNVLLSSRRLFSTSIKKVGMVGMGLMGHGIAQTAAQAGFQVIAVDANEKGLANGMGMIEKSLKKVISKKVEKGKLSDAAAGEEEYSSIMNRIEPSTSLSSLADADLVIEAIVEDIDVKIPFYKELGSIVKPSGILASNTSSLPISVMAQPSGRASKVVGLHFFNPVQMMKLVEVVKTDSTDPAVFNECKEFVKNIGKTAVSCKDTPGFIVNRLLVPSLSQALLMLERGDASMEDIDISMQFGAGHPMG